MLKDTELIQHFRLPKYPPASFLVTLFAINLVLCFIADNHMVFRLLCYVYSTLMLYRKHNQYFYLKITFAINLVVVWMFINGYVLSKFQETSIFCLFVALYFKVFIKAMVGTFLAVFLFTKPVQFDDLFWVVQIGLLAQYVNYFADLRILRFLPSFLRVVQSLRGNNRSSMISALRYSVHFTKQIFPQYTMGWIIFSIFVSTWEVYNNYWNQFGIQRLFRQKGSICLYPKKAIMYGFIAICIAQWAWVIPGRHVGISSMIRKFLWNYMRIQYRMAEMYKKYAVLSILDVDINYIKNLTY